MSAQHLSGGDDCGLKKKKVQKGHTKAPYAVYEEKKRCTSCSTRARRYPQMLYLVLERIASKYPQAAAEPSALLLTFSPSPVSPLG